MTAAYPTARTIQRALCVLERLPPVALADLAERLITGLARSSLTRTLSRRRTTTMTPRRSRYRPARCARSGMAS